MLFFLPLSPSTYPQFSLMLDHGETLQMYFLRTAVCSPPAALIVSFLFSLLHFLVLMVLIILCSAGLLTSVCDVPLHVNIFSMFASSLMHIPAQRFSLSEQGSVLCEATSGCVFLNIESWMGTGLWRVGYIERRSEWSFSFVALLSWKTLFWCPCQTVMLPSSTS